MLRFGDKFKDSYLKMVIFGDMNFYFLSGNTDWFHQHHYHHYVRIYSIYLVIRVLRKFGKLHFMWRLDVDIEIFLWYTIYEYCGVLINVHNIGTGVYIK